MDVSAPKQPSYGEQMSDTLHSQMAAQLGTGDFKDVGPLINLESNPVYGQPAWANLSLQTINQLLEGTPGGTHSVPTSTEVRTGPGWYDKSGNLVSSDFFYTAPGHAGRAAGISGLNKNDPNGIKWRNGGTKTVTGSKDVTTAATPGLMAIQDRLAQQQTAQQSRALSQQRQADIADVMKLGPASYSATNAADPGSAHILDLMTNQATRELSMGTMLDPRQTRTATQGVLANRQGMLGGTGNAGDFALALGLSQYGQDMQTRRRQFASGVLGQRQQFYGDAFNRVLGRQNTANPSAAIAQAQGISAGSYNPFNPESQYAANIYGANQQTQMAANAASASATSGLISGGMSMIGGMGAGGMFGKI